MIEMLVRCSLCLGFLEMQVHLFLVLFEDQPTCSTAGQSFPCSFFSVFFARAPPGYRSVVILILFLPCIFIYFSLGSGQDQEKQKEEQESGEERFFEFHQRH